MNRLSIPEPGTFALEMPNPKLTFICGPPYSGKQAVGQRLADELGQIHIAIDILQKNESKKDTEEGHLVAELLYLRKPVPSELRVRMLKRAFGSQPAPGYVITGFPITAEDAKLFEREIAEIKLIIFFDVWDYNRLLEKMATENAKQALLARLEDYRKNSQEAINYYRELLKVKTIPCEVYEDEMLRKTRVGMKPEVFFLIGPPHSGKTSIAKILAEKYNLMYVDGVQGKEDDLKRAQRIHRAVEDGNSTRFLIDDFPQNVQQLAHFETLFGRSGSILVLRVNKDTLIERHPSLSLDIHSRFTRFQSEYKQMQKQYGKLRKIQELSASGSLQCVLEEFGKLMEPELVIVKGDAAAGRSLKEFLVAQGYFQIRPAKLFATVCERQTAIGREILHSLELGKIITVNQFSKVLSTLIFSGVEYHDKFIIEDNYPSRLAEVEALEKGCCKIAKCYWVSVTASQLPVGTSGGESVETHMYDQHKLVRMACTADLDTQSQAPYFSSFIREFGNRKRGKAVFVIGPMLSGKTNIANYLVKKYSFTLVDYATLPDQIRAKKSTEEEPYEGDITWKDIQEELNIRLQHPEVNLLFDGLPPIDVVIPEAPVGEDGEPQDKLPLYFESLTSNPFFLGYPYCVIQLTPSGDCLKRRLMKQLEIAPGEEITEEQLAPLVQSQSFESGFADYFDGLSREFLPLGTGDFRDMKIKGFYQVDTNRSVTATQEVLDGIFTKKLILIDTVSETILKCVRNQALNNDFLYIDVPDAITEVINSNSTLGQEISLLRSLGHSPTLDHCLESIRLYMDSHLQYRCQVVVLARFLSEYKTEGYPRTIDEFFALEKKVGTVIGCLTCAEDDQPLELEVIPVIPQAEKKPEGEEDAQEEPPGDEDLEGKVETITEELDQPLRSDSRLATGVSKLFQLYKRDKPAFVIRKTTAQSAVADFFKKVWKYLSREHALSSKDEVRCQCPNMRIVV